MRAHHFHAWRRMRDLGPSWHLRFTPDLPDDVYGCTDFGSRTICLRSGLSFEERRCTITHEVEHALRGPGSTCAVPAEESWVERRSARLLLPSVRELADALLSHEGDHEEAAASLWVDTLTLDVRLDSLRADERAYLQHRFDPLVLTPRGVAS